MESQNILAQLNEIFRDVLDHSDIVLTEKSSAADVEDWDSLSHIQLVVAVEKHFKIKFTANEIQSWQNVGDIIKSITSKVKN